MPLDLRDVRALVPSFSRERGSLIPAYQPAKDISLAWPSSLKQATQHGLITEANWANATQCTGEPTPSVAGTAESFTVAGLDSGTQYWFAIKTRDEVEAHWSPISNSPTLTTADP